MTKEVNLPILRVVVVLDSHFRLFFDRHGQFGLYRVSPFDQFLSQLVVKEEDVIFRNVDDVFELEHGLQNLKKCILTFFTVHLPDPK